MKHCIVALDESGDTIVVVNIGPKPWTYDLSEAMSACALLNHGYRKGDELCGRRVGGYEVVSEPEVHDNLPMFTVLTPPGTAILPNENNWDSAVPTDEGWSRDWDIFDMSGTHFNHEVKKHAERIGIKPLFGGCGPLIIDDIAEAESMRKWEEVIPEVLAAGLTVAKLPDTMESKYYRWYVVEPLP